MKKSFISLMTVMLLVGFVPRITIEASEVEIAESIVDSASRTGLNMMINQNNVNLRTGPGTNYTSLGQVNRGDLAIHISSGSTSTHVWYQVRMTTGKNAGRTGWVRYDYTNIIK